MFCIQKGKKDKVQKKKKKKGQKKITEGKKRQLDKKTIRSKGQKD